MKKRSMVLLLALVMALGLCVTTAWAADGVSYFDPTVSGSDQNKSCETYTPVTGSTSTEPVTWEGGTSDAPKWYVVDNAVTISGKLNVTGHVNLILCDGKRLTAEKGIHYLIDAYNAAKPDKKLVIAGDTSDTDDYVEMLRQKPPATPTLFLPALYPAIFLTKCTATPILPCSRRISRACR